MTQLCSWVVRGLDIPLGWLLGLPRDVTLLLFAIATALLMTLARRAVTNQDLLRRCAQDLRQLKQLIRSAKLSRDKPQLQRLRGTTALIKGMQLTADLKVLAVVLVPIAALALWATERLDYLPPRVGEELVVRAYFPLSSIDGLTHLVPTPGFELTSSTIQQVTRADAKLPPSGIAEWTVRSSSVADDLVFAIRHHGESGAHHVAIGRPTYLPLQQFHPNERLSRTEVVLQRYRPLSLDLKTDSIGLPPWMIGYLALTLLMVPGLKRLLRVF